MFKYIFIIPLFVAWISLSRNVEAKIIDEHIYLVPAGEVDNKVVEAIKERLPDFLPMTVKIEPAPKKEILKSAYDPSRRQYGAEMILDDISRRITIDTRTESALVIVDFDLYSPELNFVFGMSDVPKAISIISLTRLRNEFYGLKPDNNLFLKRVLKEAVHEVGHAWGLSHCPDPKCVMYFSNNLSDTDRKKGSFCHDCQKKLYERYNKPLFKGSLF